MSTIWAIARALLIEIWRMRALMIFVGLVVGAYTLGMGSWVYLAEDRMDNKVQTFLSYSLSFTSVLGTFLVIFLSALTVCRDIKRKEIFTISTKPISRHNYLLGKLTGMAVFYLLFIAINGVLIYGIANYARKVEVSEDEAKVLKHLVFVARQAAQPILASDQEIYNDIKEAVERKVQSQINENPDHYRQFPEDKNHLFNKVLNEEIQFERNRRGSVEPGGSRQWHFSNVRPIDKNDGLLYVRFKQDVSRMPSDERLKNLWYFGPRDLTQYGYEGFFDNDGRRQTIRTTHEFPVPADIVGDNGDFYISYVNDPRANEGATVAFASERAGRTVMEVLYAVNSFESNFLRTLFLIYLRGFFLSILGLALGAWLSYPVAVLALLMVYLLGVSSDFIAEAMQWEGGDINAKVANIVISMTPHLAAYDPVPMIERGLLVENSLIGRCLFWMILVKGTAWALFGYLVFRMRELARVIV